MARGSSLQKTAAVHECITQLGANPVGLSPPTWEDITLASCSPCTAVSRETDGLSYLWCSGVCGNRPVRSNIEAGQAVKFHVEPTHPSFDMFRVDRNSRTGPAIEGGNIQLSIAQVSLETFFSDLSRRNRIFIGSFAGDRCKRRIPSRVDARTVQERRLTSRGGRGLLGRVGVSLVRSKCDNSWS